MSSLALDSDPQTTVATATLQIGLTGEDAAVINNLETSEPKERLLKNFNSCDAATSAATVMTNEIARD